jgi:uncharacterized protein (TIGR03435 family)
MIAHLWQSTLVGVLAALLTLLFRRNRAHVRYWLWFGASVKFLVPFALLVWLGGLLPWAPTLQRMRDRAASVTTPIQVVPRPAAAALARVPPLAPDTPDWTHPAAFVVWACGFGALGVIRLRSWRRIRAAVRTSAPLEIEGTRMPPGTRLRSVAGLLEPGVVGWWHPILLLPRGIEQRLLPRQLEAVVAHELCHVRRRDNVMAALHMATEAVFWFHPLVWWIGARLMDERERACDEEVVRQGHEPAVYAQGILEVCESYVESPLACVTGVTGSDLKRRIEAIMRNQTSEALRPVKRLLLAAAAFVTVAVPLVVGMLDAAALQAQSGAVSANPAFEVTSVKPNPSGQPGSRLEPLPGGRFNAVNVPAIGLVRFAYDLPAFQVLGGPDWLESERFDIAATAGGNVPLEQTRAMLRRVLAERFALAAHTETRELPVYALVMARSDGRLGPHLRRTQADCAREQSFQPGIGPSPSGGPPSCGYFGFSADTNLPAGRGGLAVRGLTMARFARSLVPMVRRSVVDQTGLTGYFDAEFDFLSELPPPPPPPGMPNPWTEPFVSVFTVLPEQLGLKLDSRRGPVEVLVIDAAQRPTPD